MIESLTIIVWIEIFYALLIGIVATVRYRHLAHFLVRAIMSWTIYSLSVLWLLYLLNVIIIPLNYIISLSFVFSFLLMGSFGIYEKRSRIPSLISIIYGILFGFHLIFIAATPPVFLGNLVISLILGIVVSKVSEDGRAISAFGLLLDLSLLEFIKSTWTTAVPDELSALAILLVMFLGFIGIRPLNIQTSAIYFIFPMAFSQNIGLIIVNMSSMDMLIFFIGRTILILTLLMFIVIFYARYKEKASQAIRYMLYTVFLILINNYLNTIYYINHELVLMGYTYLLERAPYLIGSVIAYIAIYSLLYASVVGRVSIDPVRIIEKIFIAFVSSLITLIAIMIGYQFNEILPLYIFMFYMFFIPSLIIGIASFLIGGVRLLRRGKTLTGLQSITFAIMALLVIMGYAASDMQLYMISGILFILTSVSFIVFSPEIFARLKIKPKQEVKAEAAI